MPQTVTHFSTDRQILNIIIDVCILQQMILTGNIRLSIRLIRTGIIRKSCTRQKHLEVLFLLSIKGISSLMKTAIPRHSALRS